MPDDHDDLPCLHRSILEVIRAYRKAHGTCDEEVVIALAAAGTEIMREMFNREHPGEPEIVSTAKH